VYFLSAFELFSALQIAFVCATFAGPLMDDGNVLEPYRRALERLQFVSERFGWLAKPLGLCPKCLAGQVAFWLGLFLLPTPALLPFTLITIGLADVLSRLWPKL
jgi:hypothetical protein